MLIEITEKVKKYNCSNVYKTRRCDSTSPLLNFDSLMSQLLKEYRLFDFTYSQIIHLSTLFLACCYQIMLLQ